MTDLDSWRPSGLFWILYSSIFIKQQLNGVVTKSMKMVIFR